MNCHVCGASMEVGCRHYKSKIVMEIVAFAHSKNKEIVETFDFLEGIKYALKFLDHTGAFRRNEK